MTGIAAPEEVCFDLSRSIDLHLESMATSKERAVGGVTSGLIGAGDEVSWDARHFGIWWRMTSRISAFEPRTGSWPRWCAGRSPSTATSIASSDVALGRR